MPTLKELHQRFDSRPIPGSVVTIVAKADDGSESFPLELSVLTSDHKAIALGAADIGDRISSKSQSKALNGVKVKGSVDSDTIAVMGFSFGEDGAKLASLEIRRKELKAMNAKLERSQDEGNAKLAKLSADDKGREILSNLLKADKLAIDANQRELAKIEKEIDKLL